MEQGARLSGGGCDARDGPDQATPIAAFLALGHMSRPRLQRGDVLPSVLQQVLRLTADIAVNLALASAEGPWHQIGVFNEHSGARQQGVRIVGHKPGIAGQPAGELRQGFLGQLGRPCRAAGLFAFLQWGVPCLFDDIPLIFGGVVADEEPLRPVHTQLVQRWVRRRT